MSPRWNVFGASVLGTSHLKTATPCQDACAYMVTESGLLLAAVSDGAGSAPRSDQGSRAAVQATIEALSSELAQAVPETHREWGYLLYRAFKQAREALHELAAEEGCPVREFAATLTFLAADEDWLATGQLGDGLAVVQTRAGRLESVAEPQRGEYADSTFFLSGEDAPDRFFGRVYRQRHDIDEIFALALLTDGLTNLAIDRASGRPHDPFFAPLLRIPAGIDRLEPAIEDLSAFLGSERLNARTDDDKTLVLAGRPGAGVG